MAKREPSTAGGAPAIDCPDLPQGFSSQDFSSYWSSSQIEALAKQLEKDKGCTIDREVFRDDIAHLDGVCWLMKPGEDETPEARAAMERVFHQCQEFRASIQEAIEAAAPNDLEVMLADVQRMEVTITDEAELIRVRYPPRGAGRPPAFFEDLIHSLAAIYEEHVGQPAGTSSGRGAAGRGGPFVRFVKSVLDVVEPDDRHTALGESVKKILRARKEGYWTLWWRSRSTPAPKPFQWEDYWRLSRECLRWVRTFPPGAPIGLVWKRAGGGNN